jgi:hypothetical protein
VKPPVDNITRLALDISNSAPIYLSFHVIRRQNVAYDRALLRKLNERNLGIFKKEWREA